MSDLFQIEYIQLCYSHLKVLLRRTGHLFLFTLVLLYGLILNVLDWNPKLEFVILQFFAFFFQEMSYLSIFWRQSTYPKHV